MDEQQSQLRKKVSDAKSLLSDEVGTGKGALRGASFGKAIKEKVVQLEQEEAEDEVGASEKVGAEVLSLQQGGGEARQSGR
jgi:hypothetical protein